MADVIEEYIDLKNQKKEIEEKYRALETIIFADDSLRNDNRIKVQSGRRTITLTDTAYENLETIGVPIYKKVKKELKDFDNDIQDALLKNPKNFNEKISKESIRINK